MVSYYYLALLPLLYTIRNSLPLAWTTRVFYIIHSRSIASTPSFHPLVPKALSYFLPKLFPPRLKKGVTTAVKPYQELSCLPPPNSSIFQLTSTSNHVASVDECDMNMHLSNSSYPKNFDFARLQFAYTILTRGLLETNKRDKAWIALGGTSFRFLKEIPMGSSYRVEVKVWTWDDKWVYSIGKFISKSKKKGGKPTVHCIALGRLCVKSGRKTIPPWFFWSICGFTPSSAEASEGNWEKAEELRARTLQKDPSKPSAALLSRFVPDGPFTAAAEGKRLPEEKGEREDWMKKDFWSVEGWEEERKKRLETVKNWTLLGDGGAEEIAAV